MGQEEIVVLGLSKSPELETGLKNASKKYNIKVRYLTPTLADLSKKLEEVIPQWQVSTIYEIVSKGVKGIAIVPLHPQPLLPVIKEVVEKGVFLITYDIDFPESERILHIGTNNYLAGKIAGTNLATILNFKGNIIIDTPSLTSGSCLGRIEGFKEAISKYENLKILEIFSCEENIPELFNIPNKILSKYKDFQGIFSTTGLVASADAQAVKISGRDIKIVCIDLEKEIVKFIQEGVINVAIAQRFYLMGERIVEVLSRMIRFGKESVIKTLPPDRFIDTGVDVVTQKTLSEYLKSQEAKGIFF